MSGEKENLCRTFLTFRQTVRALKGEFGITGLQGKNLGLWDYTLFEIGITEIRSEIGIMEFHTKPNWDYRILTPFQNRRVNKHGRRRDPTTQGNWDCGITPHLKLGLRNYTPFKIGIMELHPI